MATNSRIGKRVEVVYPDSDGKPMAETDVHRDLMFDLIQTLQHRYADEPMVYVSGDLLLYYVEGDPRKSVAPDVFVVFDVPRGRRRLYKLWEEGKGPDLVIETTSKTTRRRDTGFKLSLYRDVLRVPEYFLFDPLEDYLKPSMQGHRLVEGAYVPIEPVAGRLPSRVLGLHFERAGTQLRLFDPASGRWLPTFSESLAESRAAKDAAETARHAAETARHAAEAARDEEAQARQAVEEENERLRRELEALRGGPPGAN